MVTTTQGLINTIRIDRSDSHICDVTMAVCNWWIVLVMGCRCAVIGVVLSRTPGALSTHIFAVRGDVVPWLLTGIQEIPSCGLRARKPGQEPGELHKNQVKPIQQHPTASAGGMKPQLCEVKNLVHLGGIITCSVYSQQLQ